MNRSIVSTLAQIIWSTRHLVKVLLDIQQKFYWTRAIFLLLEVQQIFTLSRGRLVGSYFSPTRRPVENFYQTSSKNPLLDVQQSRRFWPLLPKPNLHFSIMHCRREKINFIQKFAEFSSCHLMSTFQKMQYVCTFQRLACSKMQ